MPFRLPSKGVQLNKPVILDAAQAILQEYGLADLTMRRLATALGVAPGALYWHFPNKQALLGGVAQLIMHDVAAVGETNPVRYCAALFSAVTRIRDGAEIMVAALASGTMDRDVVAELASMCSGGAPQARALVRYVLGAAWDVQTSKTVEERLQVARGADDRPSTDGWPEVRPGVVAIVTGWSG